MPKRYEPDYFFDENVMSVFKSMKYEYFEIIS